MGEYGFVGLLFGARSLPLIGALAEDDAGEYLSGPIIGAEIGEERRLYPQGTTHLAGAEPLVRRYLAAFAALGVSARKAPQVKISYLLMVNQSLLHVRLNGNCRVAPPAARGFAREETKPKRPPRGGLICQAGP